MCRNLFGGGKRYSPPPDNSLQLQREQQEFQQRQRAEEEARRQADVQARTERFNANRDSAVAAFRDRAGRRLSAMGLNPSDYTQLIEDAIVSGSKALPNLDDNPAQFFTDSLLDTQIGRTQSDRRQAFGREVDRVFTPGFETSTFADTADDSFIDSILGRQRGEAVSSLEMARRRGNLDETGFQAALRRMDEMEKSGRSTAQTLGAGVLQSYRDQVRGIADRAREAANNYTLGGQFDVNRFTGERDSRVADLSGRLEGDVNSALAGQNFFDLGDIITRGGAAQGPVNPRMNNVDQMAERDRLRNTNRGLGSAGRF